MSNAVWDSDVAVTEDLNAGMHELATSIPHEANTDDAVAVAGMPAAMSSEARPQEDLDKFYVEVVQDPDSEFGTKAFAVMGKIAASGDAFAQGLLVLPKHLPLYRYAEQIQTAGSMGIMVKNSPHDDLKKGARTLYLAYVAARSSLDQRVASFSASMQARRQELLQDTPAI